MESRVSGNAHARFGVGENPEVSSPKDYLSLSGAKSQSMKQLMAGAGVAVVGMVLVPLLSGLFG